jgi:GDP-L-fucose synthase
LNILITGGTGFLGRHLVQRLSLDTSNTITIANTSNFNLLDKERLLQLNDMRFDVIYHLAAWTKAGDFCLRYPGDQWVHNQLINTNILWYWSKYHSKATFVTMGTSCAYPDGYQDLVETDYMLGEPSIDLYTYALSKRMLLQGLRSLNMQYGLKYQYMVPSTLYGPKFERNDNHFIFDLITKIYNGKYYDHPVVLWGDGNQIRELIYVEDAIDLICEFSNRDLNQIMNISTSMGYSIRHYAETISKIFDYDANKIQYDTTAPYIGVGRRVLDNASLRNQSNDYVFTPLYDGLRSTIEYYQSITG